MKLLWNDKDGGPESKGWIWGVESKRFGSILFVLFREGTRDAYHTHAFNAVSWLLSGELSEKNIEGEIRTHKPGLKPIFTGRDTFHKVSGIGPRSLAITFRGPWANKWNEFLPNRGLITLTHGRQEIANANS